MWVNISDKNPLGQVKHPKKFLELLNGHQTTN